MGVTSIDVCDNGKGIDPENYANLALKHYTSKLTTFNDLQSVSSFGFRGEALNALCELSGSLSITTKRASDSVGTNLSFSGSDGGLLSGQTACARSTGTTVTVKELFGRLPVRRKEFQRNIKKQYQKLIRVLQSYAIIATGVRILVTNVQELPIIEENGKIKTKKGKESDKPSTMTVIGTQGSKKIQDNISAVFGNKFLQTLAPVECCVQVNIDSIEEEGADEEETNNQERAHCDDNEEGGGNSQTESTASQSSAFREVDNLLFSTSQNDEQQQLDRPPQQVTITGFVSKVGAGVGRSDNDRQFVFCNGRPVDLPKFVKVINEVWRKYEMKHKSACIIDVRVPAGGFDVNLSPDKREIVIAGESAILDTLRAHMDALFAPSRSTFQLDQGNRPGQSISSSQTAAMMQTQSSLLDVYSRSQPTNRGDPEQDDDTESEEISQSNSSLVSAVQERQKAIATVGTKYESQIKHITKQREPVWLSPDEERRLQRTHELRTMQSQTQVDSDLGATQSTTGTTSLGLSIYETLQPSDELMLDTNMVDYSGDRNELDQDDVAQGDNAEETAFLNAPIMSSDDTGAAAEMAGAVAMELDEEESEESNCLDLTQEETTRRPTADRTTLKGNTELVNDDVDEEDEVEVEEVLLERSIDKMK